MHLQVELTNYCNLHCIECPNRDLTRKRYHMDISVFEAILGMIPKINNLETIIWHKDGEPLLHPHLKVFLASASQVTTAKFDIYTNGLLLNEDIVQFLSFLPNRVCILISYHKYDHTGKENDYSKAFAEWDRCFRNAGNNIEFVMVSHLTDPADEMELVRWQTEWLNRHYTRLSAVHVNKAINHWAGKIQQKNVIYTTGCGYTDGKHFFVGVTGNVPPCCTDINEDIILGNILKDSFEDIQKNRECFYNGLREKEMIPDLCKKCLVEGG